MVDPRIHNRYVLERERYVDRQQKKEEEEELQELYRTELVRQT